LHLGRYESLGFCEAPEIEVPHSSAVTSLVRIATFERLLQHFDDRWTDGVDRLVGIYLEQR